MGLFFQDAVQHLMRWCHMWHRPAPSSVTSRVTSVPFGNIKWTPLQWNWSLCLHRKYTFNGWRSDLYSLTIVILLSWLLFSFRGRGEGFNARASAWASFNLKAEFSFFFSLLIQYCLRCAETEHLKSYIIKMMNTSVRACWLSGSRLIRLSYLCVCNWKLSLNSKRNKNKD